MNSPTRESELVERLQKREHYFLNAVEGEYDANLLRKARYALEDAHAEREKLLDTLEQIASGMIRVPGGRPVKMTTFRMSSIARAALSGITVEPE